MSADKVSGDKPTLLLFGASGRMGRAIAAAAAAAGVETCDWREREQVKGAKVLVEFSSPEGCLAAIELAALEWLPLVSGTTGLTDKHTSALASLSARVPVLHATNMSLGVAVLRRLVQQAAAYLPITYNPEIVELHHRRKKDSPSGTALTLAEEIVKARSGKLEHQPRTARQGIHGERGDEELGVFGVRGGGVAGEHTVYFIGENDRIELTHRANDRSIFAEGAVAAAEWLATQPAGLYEMADVLLPRE